MTLIPPKTFNAVAQAGHFQAGCLAVFAPVALTHGLRWGFIGAIVIVLFAAVKEFWFDHRFEDVAVRGSDLEDFLFYTLGPFVSLPLCWFFR